MWPRISNPNITASSVRTPLQLRPWPVSITFNIIVMQRISNQFINSGSYQNKSASNNFCTDIGNILLSESYAIINKDRSAKTVYTSISFGLVNSSFILQKCHFQVRFLGPFLPCPRKTEAFLKLSVFRSQNYQWMSSQNYPCAFKKLLVNKFVELSVLRS